MLAVPITRRDPGNRAMARLVIRDNGQGFEAQTGSKRHGRGLVRRLAEQVRGTANVASAIGTTWTIDLPPSFQAFALFQPQRILQALELVQAPGRANHAGLHKRCPGFRMPSFLRVYTLHIKLSA